MIFDCFTFFNEFDILDVRLHEMASVVDRFVIVEATRTFQGAPKPLHFEANKARYSAFADKIIHVVVDMPESPETKFPSTSVAWRREYYQREQIARGIVSAGKDDLIIVGDVDEIISAGKLREALARRRKHDLTIFTMPVFNAYYNRRVKEQVWLLGPRMVEAGDFKSAQVVRNTRLLASKRLKGSPIGALHTRVWNFFNCGMGNRILEIKDAGWHFSSMGNWDKFREKINAFSHEEVKDTAEFNSEAAFLERIRKGTDRVDIASLPAFIGENTDRFYLDLG